MPCALDGPGVGVRATWMPRVGGGRRVESYRPPETRVAPHDAQHPLVRLHSCVDLCVCAGRVRMRVGAEALVHCVVVRTRFSGRGGLLHMCIAAPREIGSKHDRKREIRPAELANERAYRFKGTNGAVFSWHGADIQVRILFSA